MVNVKVEEKRWLDKRHRAVVRGYRQVRLAERHLPPDWKPGDTISVKLDTATGNLILRRYRKAETTENGDVHAGTKRAG